MKRMIRASEAAPSISILDLQGKGEAEIEQILDEAPVGTLITGICQNPDRHSIDTHIEKKQAYTSNYHQGVSSPNDWKSLDTYWTVAGYKEHFILSMIMKILDGTSKYWSISPRA